MSLETYLVYLATVFVFFATPPGTSQILIMTTAVRYGARKSLPTALGDLTANTLQILIAGVGLAAVLATSATALTIIKWAGVAYLAYYGLRLYFAPAPDLGQAAPPNPRKLFTQGFVTSGANPEAVFFFAALFPQFLTLSAPLWPQLLILGGTYLIIDGTILAVMALTAEKLLGRLRERGRLLNRLAGGAMLIVAALLGAKDVQVARG